MPIEAPNISSRLMCWTRDRLSYSNWWMINYPLVRASNVNKFGCKWSILLKVTSFFNHKFWWRGDYDKIFSLVFHSLEMTIGKKGLVTKAFGIMWVPIKISKIDKNRWFFISSKYHFVWVPFIKQNKRNIKKSILSHELIRWTLFCSVKLQFNLKKKNLKSLDRFRIDFTWIR